MTLRIDGLGGSTCSLCQRLNLDVRWAGTRGDWEMARDPVNDVIDGPRAGFQWLTEYAGDEAEDQIERLT